MSGVGSSGQVFPTGLVVRSGYPITACYLLGTGGVSLLFLLSMRVAGCRGGSVCPFVSFGLFAWWGFWCDLGFLFLFGFLCLPLCCLACLSNSLLRFRLFLGSLFSFSGLGFFFLCLGLFFFWAFAVLAFGRGMGVGHWFDAAARPPFIFLVVPCGDSYPSGSFSSPCPFILSASDC